MFVYCGNNPVGCTDEEGTSPKGILNPNAMMRDGGIENIEYVLISPTGDPLWMHTLDSGKYANSSIRDEYFLMEVAGFSLSPEELSLFSLDYTAFSYRLYSEYIDIFLLDFGSVETNISLSAPFFVNYSAIASIYNPSMTLHFGKISISFAGYIGSAGRTASFDPFSGISFAQGGLFGYGFSITWS